jgi:DNA replication protein DnaC
MLRRLRSLLRPSRRPEVDRPKGPLHLRAPGMGKTHLAEVLGRAAIDEGKAFAATRSSRLVTLMRRHRADDSEQSDRSPDPCWPVVFDDQSSHEA